MPVWSNTFERALEVVAIKELDRRASRVERLARQFSRTRVKVRTGRYSGNIRTRRTSTLERTITASAPYALIVEKGSRPHVIRPKRKGGSLRFVAGGRTVYAKKVNHPGTRPQHVMRDALRQGMR